MALFKIPQGSRGIMRLLLIQLVCCFGWFSSFALAQFGISEGVTGSVANFPTLGITCVANLAVFVTTLIRGRLDLEMGARDALEILSSTKLKNIEGIKHRNGLTTCSRDLQTASVAMLSNGTPNWSMRQFMKSNAPIVHSIQLQFLRLQDAVNDAKVREELTPEVWEELTPRLQDAVNEELEFLRLQDAANDAKVREELTRLQDALNEELEFRRLQDALNEELTPRLQDALNEELVIEEFLRLEVREELTPEVREELTPRLQDAGIEEFLCLEVHEELTPRLQDALNEEQEFLRFQDAVIEDFLRLEVREELTPEVTIQTCECVPACNCIVFWTAEEITSMLVRRMPGILKPLSSSLCLLPCLTCLTKGCHGCHKEGRLRVEGPLPVKQADEGQILRESESKVVSEILNDIGARSINAEEHICICIPMHGASSDVWTELLVRSLRSKDAEGRGVRVKASEALESYLAGRREGANGSVEYNISSLIVPRLTEVVINLVLTFWFRVDGFSSALLARRTIREYLVDSKGSGLAANAFLTKAKVKVKSDDSCSQVCQVLFFRGNHVRIITLSTGCVNLICSLGWAVLISFEGGADTSPPPSMTILVLIITAIATALGMDVAGVYFNIWNKVSVSDRFLWIFGEKSYGMGNASRLERDIRFMERQILGIIDIVLSPVLLPIVLIGFWLQNDRSVEVYAAITFLAASALQTVCIVAGSAVAGTLGIKAFGRWVYGALQILVWLKWAVGSFALTREISIEFLGRNPKSWAMLTYSTAFMLNAVLAGVRCKWEAWPWKDNHLF